MRDLASTSRYPRKLWQFDTVIAQQEYAVPADLIVPLTVRVGGKEYVNSSSMEVARFATGDLILNADGAWYTDDNGTLTLWPTPAEIQPVTVQYVYAPPALALDDDEPTAFPAEFHPALIQYVASVYYATVEDNPDLSQINEERYRLRATELAQHRISMESGDQPFNIGIRGVTA